MVRKKKNRMRKAFPFEPNGLVKEEEIRVLAYRLFCEAGYQQGKDREYWLEAEKRLLGRGKSA